MDNNVGEDNESENNNENDIQNNLHYALLDGLSRNDLLVVHLNINGLKLKFHKLKLLITSVKLDLYKNCRTC